MTLTAGDETSPANETELSSMSIEQIKYQSEVTTAKLGIRIIHLENLTPILSPKQREEREHEIEKRLYDVSSSTRENRRKQRKLYNWVGCACRTPIPSHMVLDANKIHII